MDRTMYSSAQQEGVLVRRLTAFKLAIAALEKEKREYAWDANLYRSGMLRSISGERALKKVVRIEKAIKHLQTELEN